MADLRRMADVFDAVGAWYLGLRPLAKWTVLYGLMLAAGFSGAVALDASLFREFRERWGVWQGIVLPVIIFGVAYWVVMAFSLAEKRQRSAAPGGFPVAIAEGRRVLRRVQI